MTRKASLVYLTELHYKKLKKYFPKEKYLKKELRADGFKFGVFLDDKLIFCFMACYGNKPKSAYIAQLYTDNSFEAKRIMIKVIRMFDELHKDWFVVFVSRNQHKFINHSKEIKMYTYQYTGCLTNG